MPTDTINQQIEAMFHGLQRRNACDTMPAPGTLSEILKRVVKKTVGEIATIDAETLTLFATASVEMWHRSVHSFLVSISLTKASPLWASVSGYYSSHYSIRALAHLLGYFQLRSQKRILKVEVKGNRPICRIFQKDGRDHEHKFYWKKVKEYSQFVNDPFFTNNDEGQPRSDCGHRNKANYLDHINRFEAFRVLDTAYLKARVEKIANFQLSDAPIPNKDSYPDTENVQLIAYHRMVQFRKFVDEVLIDSNHYWNTHRNPEWCTKLLNFWILDRHA
jgi:hypothetical protein